MALLAEDGQAQAQRAPTAGPAKIAEGLLGRRFGDDAVVEALPLGGQGGQGPAGAVGAVALLVAGEQQGQGANVVGLGSDQLLQGHHGGGHTGFHVGGAPAVELAVLFGGHERRRRPQGLIARRHHVRMAGQENHRPAAAVASPEVFSFIEIELATAETDGRQALGNQGLAAAIVGGEAGPGQQRFEKI